MKVIDQSLTPQEAAALAKFVANYPGESPSIQIIRTKNDLIFKATSRKKTKTVNDIENAVEEMIIYQEKYKHNTTVRTTKTEEINRLKRGDFSSGYWYACTKDSDVTLSCVPTFTAFVGPRNYAYPDPLYLPSTAIYPPGTTSSGNPRTTGATIANQYRDTLFNWKRIVFALPRKLSTGDKEPVFVKIAGTITASANIQAARALLSIAFKCRLTPIADALLTSTEPPTDKPLNQWFPYVTPRGVAPYWNHVENFIVERSIRGKTFETQSTDLEKAVISYAPAPLKGRRFNNNDNVSSEVAATTELWMIKKSIGGFIDGNYVYTLNGAKTYRKADFATNLTMYDEDNGICRMLDPNADKYSVGLVDAAGKQTFLHGPWEQLSWWAPRGSILAFNLALNGYILTAEGTRTGEAVIYWLNLKGEVTSTYAGGPQLNKLYNICNGLGLHVFKKSTNTYTANYWPVYSSYVFEEFDAMGNRINYIDYGTSGVATHYGVCNTDAASYAAQSDNIAGVWYARIWRIDQSPAQLIASCEIGANQNYAFTSKGNLMYIAAVEGGHPLYEITEAGEITNLVALCRWALNEREPWKLQWRGDV
jgi:hypothetical protein